MTSPSTATPTDATPAGRQTRHGANKQLILAELHQHPGSAAADIARRTGRKRTVIASTMSRMARHGELVHAGKGFRLADTHRPSSITTPRPS